MAKKQLNLNETFLCSVDNKKLKEIRIPTIVVVNILVPQ